MIRYITIIILIATFFSVITSEYVLLFTIIFCFFLDVALVAMSIDLGSQWIKIALVKPQALMEIVLTKNSDRKFYFAIGIKRGERFFEDEAIRLVKLLKYVYLIFNFLYLGYKTSQLLFSFILRFDW